MQFRFAIALAGAASRPRAKREAREHAQGMRPILGADAGHGSILDPAVEKYLLDLHAAMDLDSLWKSTQLLLEAAIPNQIIGLTFRHDPILPLIEKWTHSMPAGFFGARRLRQAVAARPRKKFLRIGDLFANRRSFTNSAIYRRYIMPQNCAHAGCLFFWETRRLACAIVIMRTAATGELRKPEINLLRQFYPRFAIALQRLRTLERERAVRVDLEEFVRRLPLPTMLLRWNLKLLFQNRAAREFCAIWENGSEQARILKSRAIIPAEILEACRRLKVRWRRTRGSGLSHCDLLPEPAQHPSQPHVRAVIHLKQLNDAVAQPHFLIECEDLRPVQNRHSPELKSRLSHLVRLTGRQQEIAQLVCNGQSNQEIADAAHLSLPTVKKHLHTVFRKLKVTSRVQLMRLML